MSEKRIKEVLEPEYAIRPYKECNDCPYGFPIAKNSVFYSKFKNEYKLTLIKRNT